MLLCVKLLNLTAEHNREDRDHVIDVASHQTLLVQKIDDIARLVDSLRFFGRISKQYMQPAAISFFSGVKN